MTGPPFGFVSKFQGSKKPKVWLDIGTKEGEDGAKDARDLRDQFLKVGWQLKKDFVYYEDGGAEHNELGRADSRDFDVFLFPN